MRESWRIVQLGPEHEAAFADYRAEWGDVDVPGLFCKRDWDHATCVRKLAAWSRGEDMASSWVPCTTSFLVEDGVILGNSNFRHSLTDRLRRFGGHVGYAVRPSARRRGVATALLAEACEQARGRGLTRILVTCAPDNVGSVRSIESNGGVLSERFFHEGEQRDVNLYWIAL